MTTREQTIARELLDVLRVAEPTILSEPVIHAGVNTRLENRGEPAATRDEFETALRFCDGAGLLISDRNRITGNLRWTLNAQGRVALKEMRP